MKKDIQEKTNMYFFDKSQPRMIVLTLYLILNVIAKCLADEFENFSDADRKKFNHLVVDKKEGWVFIGAVNRLYQLSSDLKLKKKLITCPTVECSNSKLCCLRKPENYNKILVLDYNTSRLISCGSYSPSSCDIYNTSIENPLNKIFTGNISVAASDPNASTVAFLAHDTWTEQYPFPALYVGVTHTSDQSEVPAVATRILKEDEFLQISKSNVSRDSSAQISFHYQFRKKYIVNYVYGFSSGAYIYFLTTQMNSTQSSPYISKLIRICQRDKHYNSYTEIPIKCAGERGKEYNLAQAAFITKPNSNIAKLLGITTQDDVLFGIFSKSKQFTGNESNMPSNESALCVYSLKAINDKFSENILNYYERKEDHGLEYTYSSKEKFKQKKPVNDSNSCGLTFNTPFGGNLPVQATPVITFNTLLTAVTAVSKANFTLVILGTYTGHLHLIALVNTTDALKLNDIVLEERSPVNSDLQFDPKKEHLYAMTEYKLNKIKIRDILSLISDFNPKNGSWEGGTQVTIEVLNFIDLFKGEINIDIKVAGIPCVSFRHENSFKKIYCDTKKSNASELSVGPVEILVNGILVTSKANFTFIDIKTKDFFPKQGPSCGGTELIIQGEHLDSGSSVSVFTGNVPCALLYRNTTFLKCLTSPVYTSIKVNITLKIDNSTHIFPDPFNFTHDFQRDENGYNLQPKGIPAGGIVILLRNLSLTPPSRKLMLHIYNKNQFYNITCEIKNSSIATCLSPRVPKIDSNSIGADKPIEFSSTLVADDKNGAPINFNNTIYKMFLLYPNPVFENFSIFGEFDTSIFFIIKGKNINTACQRTDFKVLVANKTCEVHSSSQDKLICYMLKNETFEFGNFSHENIEDITVQIGNNFSQIVYKKNNVNTIVQFHPQTNDTSSLSLQRIGIFSLLVLMCLIVTLCYVYRKKYSQSVISKKMQDQINRLELCVATECKEAFVELQTEMTNLITENHVEGLPFLTYRANVMKILFPDMENYSLFLNDSSTPANRSDGLNLFYDLIKNKTFLLTFIRTMEENENFTMKNRVYIASMLMITLHNDMDYCTDIIETLLADLIEKYTQGKNHPKLLLRGTESVVEKMLSIWFTFLLHKFLRECAGEPLFKLFTAMKQYINKGPVDMITSEARYSLNQDKLIRHHIDYHSMTLNIKLSQQTANIIGLKSTMEMVSLTVLNCDTITQVKEKILDVIFGTKGYSKYPKVLEFELKWMAGTLEEKILYDNDFSSNTEGEWKQKNTLLHYGVEDGAVLTLLSRRELRSRPSSISSDEYFKEIPDTNPCTSLKFHCVEEQISESEISLLRNNEAYFKEWHLVKPCDPHNDGSDHCRIYKMVSEVYLTRVLATKSTLQRFVDDLFKVILISTHQIRCFPIAIKYMFDFLDDQAALRGITDPEVVHTWKNNCLPLRFWVNLIKNPNFLFDVHKSDIIDSSLSVVAQAFMDSCSTADHNLDKDSPTSKLLYAKDIPTYKKWVKKYYGDIKAMPAVSRKQMKTIFMEELLPHGCDFNTNSSIRELYRFIRLYKNELMVALREDQISRKYSLTNKLEKVIEILDN